MRALKFIFCLSLILLFSSCNFLREKGIIGRKQKREAEMRARLDSIRIADSLRKEEDRIRQLGDARLDSLRKAEEERVRILSARKYNIVVGSFLTPAYAESYAEEYRELGYDPEIVSAEGSPYTLVIAESHPRYPAAAQRIAQFHDTVSIDAWIYVRK